MSAELFVIVNISGEVYVRLNLMDLFMIMVCLNIYIIWSPPDERGVMTVVIY